MDKNEITISVKMILMKRESRNDEYMKGGKHEYDECECIQNKRSKVGKWNGCKHKNEMLEHMKAGK